MYGPQLRGEEEREGGGVFQNDKFLTRRPRVTFPAGSALPCLCRTFSGLSTPGPPPHPRPPTPNSTTQHLVDSRRSSCRRPAWQPLHVDRAQIERHLQKFAPPLAALLLFHGDPVSRHNRDGKPWASARPRLSLADPGVVTVPPASDVLSQA